LRRLELSEAADADIANILDYGCGRFGERVGVDYVTGLNDAVGMLCAGPTIAPMLPLKRRRDVYGWLYRSHRIVFTYDADRLFVIRVLHARMDFSRLDLV